MTDAEIDELFGKVYAHCVVKYDPEAGKRVLREALATPSPAPVSAPSPAGGVREAAEVLYERHRDRCRGHHGKRIMPPWKDALPETQALYREDAAALSSPATPEPVSAPATDGEVVDRITEYLARGGLFNPEHMDHAAVRDLLMDCRAVLSSPAIGEIVADALEQCEEYFDNRADADCEGDPGEFVPNKEMRLLSVVREAIAALSNPAPGHGEAER